MQKSLVANVISVGNLLARREGADDAEAGRDRRELREPQGEGGVIHDQQDRAITRRTERYVCSDGRRPCWENVDEVRRGSMCYNYGMMGHVARDCRRNGMVKVKGGEGGKEYAQGRGNTTKDMGKERRSQIWRTQGRMFRRTERLRIPRTVLDVRQGRTQVIRMSMERVAYVDEEDACRQPKMRRTTSFCFVPLCCVHSFRRTRVLPLQDFEAEKFSTCWNVFLACVWKVSLNCVYVPS